MKIRDIMRETPIVGADAYDQRPPGQPTNALDPDTSFTGKDKKKIRSPKWREMLVGKWKDPRKFYLVFVDVGLEYFEHIAQGGIMRGDDEPTAHPILSHWDNPYSGKPIDAKFVRELERIGITFKTDAINVVYLGNDGSTGGPQLAFSHPLSPWVLAHRFAHSCETMTNNNMLVRKAKKKMEALEETGPNFVEKYGTFKSARDNNIVDVGEDFAELMAQKVVSGTVKFNVSSAEIDEVARLLNAGFDEVLAKCVGKAFAV